MRIENKIGALRPIMLVLAVWIPILILLVLEPKVGIAEGRWISQNTGFINFFGVASIILGIVLSKLLLAGSPIIRISEHWGPRADLVALTTLLLCSLLGAYFGVLAWRDLGVDPLSLGDRTLYEMNVIYAQEERVISGLTGRLITLALIGLLYVLYILREKRISWTTGLIFAFLFTAAMISPRRALLLSAMISAVMLSIMSQDKIRSIQLFKVTFVILTIILLFGFTQYLLQKSDQFSFYESLKSVFAYYITSFYVMDSLIDTNHFNDTFIVLAVPERIFSSILGYSPNVDLSIPFVFVPGPANTVPAFYYFYKSGGLAGVIVFSFLIGWIFLRLYAKMRADYSLFNAIATSLFATGIILTPRQCLFIEYDFIFLIIVTLLLDWLRRARWFRRNSRRVSAVRRLKEPII